MKSFFKFLDVIFTIIIVVWYAVEILAIPALFVVIGVLNNYPWQYYAITIGGFFLLFAIIDIVCHFLFKAFEKKYTPIFERILYRFFNRFSGRKSNNQDTFFWLFNYQTQKPLFKSLCSTIKRLVSTSRFYCGIFPLKYKDASTDYYIIWT